MGSTIAPPQFDSPLSVLSKRERQYRQALEEANRVRIGRSTLKRRINEQPDKQSSCRMCAEAISDPPDVLATIAVVDLLMCCRQIGMTATRKILYAAQVPETRKLEALTSAQRQRLIAALGMIA